MNRSLNNVYIVIATALSFVALLTNVVCVFVMFFSKDVSNSITIFNWLDIISKTISFLFALIYLFNGYHKIDSKWYKFYVLSFCITLVLAIISTFKMHNLPNVLASVMICCFVNMLLIVLIISLIKNLGKTISMTLTIINMILPLLLVFTPIFFPDYFLSLNMANKVLAVSYIVMFILSFVLFIATKSKYVDKTERGTI